MKKNDEFEIKSYLNEEVDLNKLLEKFEYSGEFSTVDEYFDTSKKELFQKGIFLRIRNGKQLDLKFNPDLNDVSHLGCKEFSWNLDQEQGSFKELFNFLSENLDNSRISTPDKFCEVENLFKHFQIDNFVEIKKIRELYKNQDGEVCLDVVSHLGKFIEIEVEKASRIETYLNWVQANNMKHLPVGYVELYLKKNNPKIYKQGVYLLPEDR